MAGPTPPRGNHNVVPPGVSALSPLRLGPIEKRYRTASAASVSGPSLSHTHTHRGTRNHRPQSHCLQGHLLKPQPRRTSAHPPPAKAPDRFIAPTGRHDCSKRNRSPPTAGDVGGLHDMSQHHEQSAEDNGDETPTRVPRSRGCVRGSGTRRASSCREAHLRRRVAARTNVRARPPRGARSRDALAQLKPLRLRGCCGHDADKTGMLRRSGGM